MHPRHRPTARFWYAFDGLLARGPLAQIGLLAAFAGTIILIGAGFLAAAGISPDGAKHWDFPEALWMALAHAFDGGTMGNDPPDWPYRAVMFTITLVGLLIVSALIGLITTAMVKKLDDLRRGRTVVMEEDHTLILGWSANVFTILSELAIANEHRRRPCVVILADRDKVEMEQEIRRKAPALGKTRVVCRTGSPIDLDDLAIANPDAARSIIVLAPEREDADNQVLKTILALTKGPDRKPGKYHIVAEMQDPKKRDVAKLVAGDEVEVLLTSDVVTRLTVQTCFQSGLSIVYNELFDFDGDEIYLHHEPELAGWTFGDALFAFTNATLVGLRFADGRIALNPPMHTIIAPGDRLFVIARDARSIVCSTAFKHPIMGWLILHGHARPAGGPRRTLILGWNRRVPAIIREMEAYVSAGSEVTIVADLADPAVTLEGLRPLLQNQAVVYWRGDTTDRTTLDALDVFTYDHVIVVGYVEAVGPEEADARTLVTLLFLRGLVERTGARANVVSEMVNVRNRDLARVTRVDDFIVSSKLVSLILAQVSENKALNALFADLLDAEGMEIYLKPAGDYVSMAQEMTVYTIVEAARLRGEVAIGYRLMAPEQRRTPMDGVVLNPSKLASVRFGPEDRIIVLAAS